MGRRFMAFRIFWAWDLNRFGMQFWCDLCGRRFHSWPTAAGYWIVDFLLVQSTFSFFTSPLNWLEIHLKILLHWYSYYSLTNWQWFIAQNSSPSGAQCVSERRLPDAIRGSRRPWRPWRLWPSCDPSMLRPVNVVNVGRTRRKPWAFFSAWVLVAKPKEKISYIFI